MTLTNCRDREMERFTFSKINIKTYKHSRPVEIEKGGKLHSVKCNSVGLINNTHVL